MQQPTRLISTPFAQEGEKTEIQNVTGEFDNSATYRLGFPPLTMQSIRSGGKPPKGTDFNGVLFDITENISFLCKGGRYQYNAGLSTLIGGYPKGSNLLLDDDVTEVVSTVAGNQNNPNTDMTGWTFKPNKTTAANVADASGETQQQVNYNGGSKWHSRVGGYKLNERVVLANGNIVKSAVNGNTNNPNVDMTGWKFDNDVVNSIAELLAIQNPKDGQRVAVTSYNPVNYALAEPYSPRGGGDFKYISALSSKNDGGVVINGWVRQDFGTPNPYFFGAYGDWNASAVTGNDDTVAFQKCIDYVLTTEPNLRAGGKRLMRLKAGNYNITTLNISSNNGWGFEIYGEGLYSCIWSDAPVIFNVTTEFTRFRSFTVHGVKDYSSYYTLGQTMFNFKLINNRADIDAVFNDVKLFKHAVAFKVHGRGLTFRNGSVQGDMFCDIVCDPSIIYDTYFSQGLEGSMRHYVFENSRTDGINTLFHISGTGALKDYINAMSIVNNQLLFVKTLISGADCTIRGVIIANNIGGGIWNLISVPRVDGLIDANNRWAYDWTPSNSNQFEIDSMYRLYAISNYARSVKITGNVIKGSRESLMVLGKDTPKLWQNFNVSYNEPSTAVAGDSYDINISNNTFTNFANAVIASNVAMIDFGVGTLKDVKIIANTVKSPSTLSNKYWVLNAPTGIDSLIIKDNITEGTKFARQTIPYTAQLYADSTLITSVSDSYYWRDGDFIRGVAHVTATNITVGLGGLLTITLPTSTVIAENIAASSLAGAGAVVRMRGLANTPQVEIRTLDNRIRLMSNNGAHINATERLSNNLEFAIEFYYRVR